MAPATPDLEAQVLAALQSTPKFDTYAQAKALGVDHQALVGAVKSLWADEYVTMDQKSATWLNATKEGCDISKNGSPEYKVYAAVSQAGSLPVADLEKSVGKVNAKVGLGAAMREKWLKKGPDGSLSVAKEGVADVISMVNFRNNKAKFLVALATNVKRCRGRVAESTEGYLGYKGVGKELAGLLKIVNTAPLAEEWCQKEATLPTLRYDATTLHATNNNTS